MESTLLVPGLGLAMLAAGGFWTVRQHSPAMRERRQTRARYARLTRGAVIDFSHASNLGVDDRWLYVVDHWAMDERGLPRERLRPTRYRLDDIRSLGKAFVGEHLLLVVGLSGDKGRLARICSPIADRASRDRVFEALRHRIVPPTPASPQNAPSPLSALLRTIAPREWDAERFYKRYVSLPQDVLDDPLLALRTCAEPRVVFSMRRDAGPGREQWFGELFRAWGRRAEIDAVRGDSMPAFLQHVAIGAWRVGLKLWLVDTRADNYAGFLTTADRDAQVRALCRHAGIDLIAEGSAR